MMVGFSSRSLPRAPKTGISDSAREPVIGGVCPDFGLERPERGRRVDNQELGACHAGVVLEGLKADRGGHGGVVCRAGGEPGGGGSREVGSGLPYGPADGQLRERSGRGNELYLVGDQP